MQLNAIEDIEESIVSWVLNNGDQFHSVAERLVPDDFMQSHLGEIWRCFNWLASHEKNISPEAVSYRLEQLGARQTQSAVKALSRLSNSTLAAVETHISLVHKDAQRRRLAHTLRRYTGIVEDARDANIDLLIHELETAIHAAHPLQSVKEPTIEEALQKIIEAQERVLDGEQPARASLGLTALNEATGGGKAKELVIIAGRPSNGKTLMAIRSSLENAILKRSPTLFFSLEMPREQLLHRCIATLSGLPYQIIDLPTDERLKEFDVSRRHYDAAFGEAVAKLRACPLHIDDRSEHPEKHPSALLKAAKRWHAHFGGLGQVVIDYLQLTDPEPGSFNLSQERLINHASKSFKGMAKALNTNVLALSQLNRNLELREDKRPVLSDLRGSGSIEEDGDIILFVYQDQLYNRDTPIPNTLEIIIGKQRNGPLGTILADLDLTTSSIINLSEEEIIERLRQLANTKKNHANQRRKHSKD